MRPKYSTDGTNHNQFYNYFVVLGAAIKCKPYSEITVESRTQLKTVKITSNIFAEQSKQINVCNNQS